MPRINQDSPLAAPKVEHRPEATFIFSCGPVMATSHLVCALQVADLVVWSVQRYLIRRANMDNGTATEIEMLARNVVAAFAIGFDDRGVDTQRS